MTTAQPRLNYSQKRDSDFAASLFYRLATTGFIAGTEHTADRRAV